MADLLAAPGEVLLLVHTLSDRSSAFFPRATILDGSAAVVAQLPLSHLANGVYITNWTVPSTPGKFHVDYQIFEDAGLTASAGYGPSEDTITSNLAAANPAVVAAAVWDESELAHATPGTFGHITRTTAAIAAKRNLVFDSPVYNADGFLVSCRLRVFPNAATAIAATAGGTVEGEIATLLVTGTADTVFKELPDYFLGVEV